MAHLIVEQTFETALTDQAHAQIGQRLDTCLEAHGARWVRSYLSTDRRRMVCEFEAADAESVRESYRSAGVRFDRAWPAEVYARDAVATEDTGTVKSVVGGLMDRYLVETPHTENNCRDLIGLINAAGYLNHFDWGCMGGVHCGWATIEAESEAHARLVVPPLVRGAARVVKIVKITPSMLNAMHQQ
jgi:hypothetical protein